MIPNVASFLRQKSAQCSLLPVVGNLKNADVFSVRREEYSLINCGQIIVFHSSVQEDGILL